MGSCDSLIEPNRCAVGNSIRARKFLPWSGATFRSDYSTEEPIVIFKAFIRLPLELGLAAEEADVAYSARKVFFI